MPSSKLPPLLRRLRSASNEGAKGLPLYVDTPRPESYVSLYDSSMLTKFQCCIQTHDICPEGYCQTFVVRPKKPISSSVISIYLRRRHLYMCTRSTLPPGTCPAEPLRTGEYNQHV